MGIIGKIVNLLTSNVDSEDSQTPINNDNYGIKKSVEIEGDDRTDPDQSEEIRTPSEIQSQEDTGSRPSDDQDPVTASSVKTQPEGTSGDSETLPEAPSEDNESQSEDISEDSETVPETPTEDNESQPEDTSKNNETNTEEIIYSPTDTNHVPLQYLDLWDRSREIISDKSYRVPPHFSPRNISDSIDDWRNAIADLELLSPESRNQRTCRLLSLKPIRLKKITMRFLKGTRTRSPLLETSNLWEPILKRRNSVIDSTL